MKGIKDYGISRNASLLSRTAIQSASSIVLGKLCGHVSRTLPRMVDKAIETANVCFAEDLLTVSRWQLQARAGGRNDYATFWC